MLLIDGVKYELWTPPSEDEFEQIVKEHTKEIFGEKSEYFDKRKLKSASGIVSIPDGYAIVFGSPSQWHIVEMELSSHPFHEHIVSQVSKFINGIKSSNTQREIASAIYDDITSDEFRRLRIRQATEPLEIYKFLSDLISKPPVLTIIIEEEKERLREAISTLNHPQIEVVEFQTFTKEGQGLAVHGHLFEPLFKTSVPAELQVPFFSPTTPESSFVVVLRTQDIGSASVKISKENRHLFPNEGTTLELETNIGTVKSKFSIDPRNAWLGRGLAKWFRAHPELKVKDKVKFTVIEPMKKYRLELVR